MLICAAVTPMNGFDIVVPRETTTSFTDEDYESGLKYLKEVYGADVCNLEDTLADIAANHK